MRFHHALSFMGIVLLIGKALYACPPDMNSVGIVLNNGEHASYRTIESYGSLGVNYLREIIGPVAAGADTILQRSLYKKQASSVSLISQDFEYDPTASSPVAVSPMFAFNSDTLVLNDYWALSEQPAFRCSLSVSNDTLYISYLPVIGPVNDWTPTVKTTLTILINTSFKSLTVCFKAVPYARPPTEIGFRNAAKDFYAFLSVPPLAAYKYRAHSDSSVMVYLGYEQMGTYKYSPRISVSSDAMSDSSRTDLFDILINELQWLSGAGICSLAPDLLQSLSSKAPRSGGLCYWSKQDSIIALNQWFLLNGDLLSSQSLLVYGMRGGCGLGTEFDLPASELAASSSVSEGNSSRVSNVASIKATVKNGSLDIVSQTIFDNIRVFNPMGRIVFSHDLGGSSSRATVSLSGKAGIVSSGMYILVLGQRHKIIYCQSLLF